MSFVHLFQPTKAAPKFQERDNERIAGPINSGLAAIIRDQMSLSSWLAIGAIFEGLLYMAIGRLAFVLPATLLTWRLLDAFLQANGYRHNPYMDGVIQNKFSAQMPDQQGNFSGKPADGEVCVLQLGFRSNHPFGLLGPGAKETGDYFMKMMKDMRANSEKYGLVGSASWISAGERSTSNELMTTFYFRSIQHIHDFAMSESHREGWNWWNKTVKQHPHLAIWHEVFRAPSGNWETIYVNSKPTGFAATRYKITTEKGEEAWQSPIVEARKGLLRTSAGRMSRSGGDEHVEFEGNTYDNYA